MIVKTECPHCGAELEYDDSTTAMYCEFCNTQIIDRLSEAPQKTRPTKKPHRGIWQIILGLLFIYAMFVETAPAEKDVFTTGCVIGAGLIIWGIWWEIKRIVILRRGY